MPWAARRPKMCSMIGVSTTGAMGLGISPVSGKSLVPFPAASAIAFTRPPATRPPLLYIQPRARKHFTPALPYGQVRRAPETLHGVEDRWARRRPAGARERRGGDRSPTEGPRAWRPGNGARR